MISATIVTYNEAAKLQKCLQSIADWVDEIIIVDLGSSDHTAVVAASFQAKLIKHPFVSYVELVRNFAIKQCSGDWILVLDPDEQVPKTLQDYLLTYAQTHATGALNIPRMNIFFGRWIAHTNFWPDYQIRFFSKGTVRWRKQLHSYPTATIPATKLPLHKKYAIKHEGYHSFASFINRQHRYALIRAQERYNQGERFSLWSLIYLPSREFLARYIKHRGFLDGVYGILLVVGLMYYFVVTEWQLKIISKKMQKANY